MTTKEYMLQCIQADAPCSLRHIWIDCKFQGFTKGFVQALHELKMAGLIATYCDDGQITVELI